MQIKRVAAPGTGHTPSRERTDLWLSDECVVPWFTLADVWQIRDGGETVVTTTAERVSFAGIANSSAVLHPAGTVLLSRTASVGFSAVMGIDMAVSQDYMTWTPGPQLDSRFLLYVLRGQRQEFGRLMSGSTHKTIYMPDLLGLRTPLPPLERQIEIAAFLDRECARIEALSSEVSQFMQTAQSGFNELVRRTIVGMGRADSVPVDGEWFSDVPRDWSAKPLGLVANFANGFAFKPEDWGEEGMPILRIEHLNGAPLLHRTTRPTSDQYVIQKGDLLFAWSGNRGTSFGPHRWLGESPALLNQHIFRISSPENRDWLYWVLRAATLFVEEQAHGIIGMVHITKGRLRKVRVPVPPGETQAAIAASLDHALAEQRNLEGELGALRGELKLYRDALIAEAVTGQIDVVRLSVAQMDENLSAVRQGEHPEVLAS